jgi:hypothetical protein
MIIGTAGDTRNMPDATIVTMIEVDVEELWTSTVARMPIISPAIGFCRSSLSLSALPLSKSEFSVSSQVNKPAAFPPSSLKAELRKSSEQMKK